MLNASILRRVDSIGRIVIPMEVRRILNIAENEKIEIIQDNNRLLLKKTKPSCVFCGNDKEMITFKGKHVCLDCKNGL